MVPEKSPRRTWSRRVRISASSSGVRGGGSIGFVAGSLIRGSIRPTLTPVVSSTQIVDIPWGPASRPPPGGVPGEGGQVGLAGEAGVEPVELGDHGRGEVVVVGQVVVEAAVGPGGADPVEDVVELPFAVDDGLAVGRRVE